jgi:DNA repair exonuclease SbcCD ATPase subunit
MCAALFGGKGELSNDMTVVYEGLAMTYKNRRDYAKSWVELGKKIEEMMKGQIPSLQDSFKRLTEMLEEFAKIHEELADKEERSSEDFRDILERYAVIFRVREEYDMRKAQFAESCVRLDEIHRKIENESVKANWEKNRVKYEALLEDAKADKTDWLRRYKRKTAQMIAVKDAYNKFKVRRMRHGWFLYADAMKEAAQKEMEILLRMRHLLEGLSADGVAEELSTAISGQLATPAPAAVDMSAVQQALSAPPVAAEPVQQEPESLFKAESRGAPVAWNEQTTAFGGVGEGLSNPFE